jgi:hypothetical protein
MKEKEWIKERYKRVQKKEKRSCVPGSGRMRSVASVLVCIKPKQDICIKFIIIITFHMNRINQKEENEILIDINEEQLIWEWWMESFWMILTTNESVVFCLKTLSVVRFHFQYSIVEYSQVSTTRFQYLLVNVHTQRVDTNIICNVQ